MASVTVLKTRLDDAEEIAVAAPQHLDKSLFNQGFQHGMRSNKLTNFKASFRAGFRAAKIHIRETMKEQGVIPLPMHTKFRAR